MRIVKATDAERAQYAISDYGHTRPLYPLHAWVFVDGVRLPVEYLGEGREGMNYEVLAPDGQHFADDATHSLLATNMKDLRDRLRDARLTRCTESCCS